MAPTVHHFGQFEGMHKTHLNAIASVRYSFERDAVAQNQRELYFHVFAEI